MAEARARRPLRTALAAALAVAAVVVVVVLLVSGGDDDSTPEVGTPTEVSVEQLREFAADEGRPVYWAGEMPGTKLELTETTRRHVFVRYLPELAPIGDRKPNYLTVATYPQADALATVRRSARNRGNQSRSAPNGGIAVWNRERPTSVYVAFPDTDYLIEVFHPRAASARELALSASLAPAS